MIHPVLLSLSSADLDTRCMPPAPENCSVSVTATIGGNGGTAADNFSFLVATPAALAESNPARWGRGILIVESFSWAVVERAIHRLLAHCARDTWLEVAQALNQELLWEYDNYRPFDG